MIIRAGGNIDIKRGQGEDTIVKATVKGPKSKKEIDIDQMLTLEGNKLTVERRGFPFPGILQTVDLEIFIPDGSTLQVDNTGRIIAGDIKCILNLKNLGEVSVAAVEGDISIKNMGRVARWASSGCPIRPGISRP